MLDSAAHLSPERDDPVIESERGGHMCAMAVVNWFARTAGAMAFAPATRWQNSGTDHVAAFIESGSALSPPASQPGVFCL